MFGFLHWRHKPIPETRVGQIGRSTQYKWKGDSADHRNQSEKPFRRRTVETVGS